MNLYFHNCSEETQNECESWISSWNSGTENFEVKTSGSTGIPKAIHLERFQLQASAERSNACFGLNSQSKILLPLSPKTIGAKMLLIRALLTDSEVHVVQPSAHVLESIPADLAFDFASLVPMQLKHLQENSAFSRFAKILLGGAPVPEHVETAIAALHPDIYYGFGMTETVSHIALRKLGDPWYHALKGVSFSQTDGKLIITDEQLKLERLQTNDLVLLNGQFDFQWLGRSDFAINSGGIKIHPELIERETGHLFSRPFLISSVPDVTLGEKVILVTEENLSPADWDSFVENIAQQFGKYARPKMQVQLEIPLNAAGKPDRLAVKQLIETLK